MTTDDLKQLDSEALNLLSQRVTAEVRRRRALRDNEAKIDQLISESQEAEGIVRGTGEPWVQPAHALDAYSRGATVTHNGKHWQSTTPINTWEPGVSGWHHLPEADPETGEPGVPEWVRPSGAHDAYEQGQQVLFEGAVYESIHPGANTWSPTEYPPAWERLEALSSNE